MQKTKIIYVRVIALGLIIICLLLISSCHKHDSEVHTADLWQKLNSPYFGNLSDVQFVSSDTGYIMGYDNESPVGTTIIKTVDGGQTWDKIYFPHSSSDVGYIRPNHWLEVSPFNSNILFSSAFVSNQEVIVRSVDGGYHWTIIDKAPSAGWGKYHFFSPANVVRSGKYIYTSADSGFTWSNVYQQNGFAFFTMLQFTSNQTGYTCGGITYDATDYGIMAKTNDGGSSWQPVNYPFRNITGMSFIDDNVGYITMDMDSTSSNPMTYKGSSVLCKTINGGKTWHTVNKKLPAFLVGDLYFRNEQDGFMVGASGTSSSIYHTTDGGITWLNEFPDANAYLVFPNSSCCYAIDKYGNIFKRTF